MALLAFCCCSVMRWIARPDAALFARALTAARVRR
jgi:hypothetical protein